MRPEVVLQNTQVSIHAPARGATWRQNEQVKATTGFNPRTREGCDLWGVGNDKRITLGFNPRTREGCDLEGQAGLLGKVLVSIHAPARGATPWQAFVRAMP